MSRFSSSQTFPSPANNAGGTSAARQAPRAIYITEAIDQITTAFANIDFTRFSKVFHADSTIHRSFVKWNADQFTLMVMNAFPNFKLDKKGQHIIFYSDAQLAVRAKEKLKEHVYSLEIMFRAIHDAGFDIGRVMHSLASLRKIISESSSELQAQAIPPTKGSDQLAIGAQIGVDVYKYEPKRRASATSSQGYLPPQVPKVEQRRPGGSIPNLNPSRYSPLQSMNIAAYPTNHIHSDSYASRAPEAWGPLENRYRRIRTASYRNPSFSAAPSSSPAPSPSRSHLSRSGFQSPYTSHDHGSYNNDHYPRQSHPEDDNDEDELFVPPPSSYYTSTSKCRE